MTRNRIFTVLGIAALLVAALPSHAQQSCDSTTATPRDVNSYNASGYNTWRAQVFSGNASTGSSSIVIRQNGVTLCGGYRFQPFSVTAPIIVGVGANAETVTPTAVGSCSVNGPLNSCTVTASFSNTHGPGELVVSGTAGLQEAINDAFASPSGGGVVSVGPAFTAGGGTTTMLAAAVVYPGVSIRDERNGVAQMWTITQTASTVLAAPATLVAGTAGFSVAGANLTGGSYTGSSTYIACIAYVDIAGQEGPCSATFTIATSGVATTDQIGFTAPAASAGAVGFIPYISLAGGTYNLTYQVPLTSSVCTLTKLESVTPACAVTNATYGQTGSAAIVSALTVNTAPLHLLATTASTTSAYIGSPNGRTTYGYVPHNAIGTPGLLASSQAFAIAPATATTVPAVLGTLSVPAGIMNLVGRTLHICGTAVAASAGSAATIENLELLWDGAGSDTAGAPVIVENLTSKVTLVTANIAYLSFCGDVQTTVAGAGVTAGSLMPVGGYLAAGSGAAGAQATGAGMDELGAAVASLNLAGTGGNSSRIHVVYNHTTATDATGFTLLGLTVTAI